MHGNKRYQSPLGGLGVFRIDITQFAEFDGFHTTPTKSDLFIKQFFELGHILIDFGLELADISEDFGRGRIFDGDVLSLFVFIDREVVVVGSDFVFGDEEGGVCSGAFGFCVGIPEAGDDIGDIVLVDRGALIIEREAVCLHIVEPHIVSTAVVGLGKDEDSGRDACIGLEDAGWHGDDSLEAVLLDEGLADGLMGFRAAEEYAVGHDAGTAPANAEHAQEQREEKELRLFCIASLKEVCCDDIGIDRPFEGRVGEDEAVIICVPVLV